MKKTSTNGVYTRKLNNGEISYIITYKIKGIFYKKTLGTNIEGWNINKAFRERANRIGQGKAPITKKEESKTLNFRANEYFISISHKSDYKNTLGRYNNHIKPYIGSREFNSITVSDIQTLKLKLSKVISSKTNKELSAKTINDMINLINTIYNYYNKINYNNTVVSPARNDLVERYSQDNSRLRFLTKAEYSELLKYIENKRRIKTSKNVLQQSIYSGLEDLNYIDSISALNLLQNQYNELLLYVKLLTTTGMRTYSALTLRAKDFDFTNDTITVKNHKSNRIYTSFIHNSIKEELQLICSLLDKEQYIFGRKNEPLHRSTLNRRLLPIMNKLFNQGVNDIRERVVVHSLRHTFGSWLAQKGVSLYVICKLLDHKDISMTQVYSKLAPDSGKEYIDFL